MDHVDLVRAKEMHEALHAAGIDWTGEPIWLGREAGLTIESTKPADAFARTHVNDGMAPLAQLHREAKGHHFRAPGPIRLHHHRDAQRPARRRHRSFAH